MINEIRRMQQLAGIKLNELEISNPKHVFKTQDEYKDEEYTFMELLDKDGNQHGWIGHIENDNSYIDVEFLFEEGEDESNKSELYDMENLEKYCKKYKIKYNYKDVNDDGELIYIQIPLKNIDVDLNQIS